MPTIPTTAATIMDAFREDIRNETAQGLELAPGEWESAMNGTPVIKVTVQNATSTGRYLVIIVQAGIETSMGDQEAGPMIRYEIKRYDGRMKREECAERFMRSRGLHKAAEVPVRYKAYGF